MTSIVLVLKLVHVLGAAVLFGTGLGIAFFMYMAHRTRNSAVIAQTGRVVVIADARHLAPGLSPRFVKGAAARVYDAQAVPQRRRTAEFEAEHRRCQERAPVALHHVVELTLVGVDHYDVAAVG